MTHSWQLWEKPTIAGGLRVSMLQRLQYSDDESIHERIYMRVYEAYGEGLVSSGTIAVLNFVDEVAEIKTDRDALFVMTLDDPAWGFRHETLANPGTLEVLIEMLKSVSSPTVSYRLHTNGQRVVIVQEIVIEPEVPVMKQTCPCGELHQLVKHVADSREGRVRHYGTCRKCGAVVDMLITNSYVQ